MLDQETIIPTLWNCTAYYALSEPGFSESQKIMQILQKTLQIYSVFHSSLQLHFNQSSSLHLNIPVMRQFRDQMLVHRFQTIEMLEREASKITNILNRQAQYAIILQISHQEAKQQFVNALNSFVLPNVQLTTAKQIIQKSRTMSAHGSITGIGFQKWSCQFGIRANKFFNSLYRLDWKKMQTFHFSQFPLSSLNNVPFSHHPQPQFTGKNIININNQNYINLKSDNSNKIMEHEYPFCKENIFIQVQKDYEMEEEGKRDIVSEIFEEIQSNNDCVMDA